MEVHIRPCKGATVAIRTCLGMPDDTLMSCAKMAEQIEMLFGFWTQVGSMKRQRCGLMSNYFEHLLYVIADVRMFAHVK